MKSAASAHSDCENAAAGLLRYVAEGVRRDSAGGGLDPQRVRIAPSRMAELVDADGSMYARISSSDGCLLVIVAPGPVIIAPRLSS